MSIAKAKRWLETLIGMFIAGGATAALSTLGLASAHGMGWNVKPLDGEQFLGVFLSGGIIPVLKFLQKSPLPGYRRQRGGTEFIHGENNQNHRNRNNPEQ